MFLPMSLRLKSWADAGLNFLYPPVCQICSEQRAIPEEGYVCAECWMDVRFIRPPFCERCGLPYEGEITSSFECSNCREMELHFVSARSAVAARGIVLEVVHRYKYMQALWFEPFLANLLISQAKPLLEKETWDYIVPVPLHPLKRREREFNQAERLAHRLGRAIQRPVNTHLLERVAFTRTQTKLTKPERMANVRSAFRLRRPQKLKGEKIILLDDVLTTGSTTNACAKALREAGAGEIGVWTVARGL